MAAIIWLGAEYWLRAGWAATQVRKPLNQRSENINWKCELLWHVVPCWIWNIINNSKTRFVYHCCWYHVNTFSPSIEVLKDKFGWKFQGSRISRRKSSSPGRVVHPSGREVGDKSNNWTAPETVTQSLVNFRTAKSVAGILLFRQVNRLFRLSERGQKSNFGVALEDTLSSGVERLLGSRVHIGSTARGVQGHGLREPGWSFEASICCK